MDICRLMAATTGVLYAVVVAEANAGSIASDGSLEEIVVTATHVDDGYVERSGMGALKMDVDIRDVPASMQFVSPQLIRDQSAGQSINAVLHNVSGVSQSYGSATGNLPAVSIRGFDTGGYTLVDGYPRASGASYDWSSIERLEVLKGPASLLYGMQYNIGGSINVVTRKPTKTTISNLDIELGSWKHGRIAYDRGGALPFGNGLSYRLDLAADSSDSFRDSVYEKNIYVAPSVHFPLGGNDELLLRGDVHIKRYVPDGGLPGPGASWSANALDYWYPGTDRARMGYAMPKSAYVGVPGFDRYRENNQTLLVEWTHQFNAQWRVKTGVSPGWTRYSGQAGWYWWDQPTDDLGNTLPVVNHLFAGSYGYRTVEWPANIDINGSFHTGGIEHKLLFGVAYDSSRTRDSGPLENTFLRPTVPVGSLDWMTHPNFDFEPDPDFAYGSWRYSQRSQGVYIQDMMSIGERWKVLLGYRQDEAKGYWEYISGSDVFNGDFTSRGGTPRFGIVFEPGTHTSWYLSWSRSFNPNWGRLIDGSLPPPELGVQTELGFKMDAADGRLNINVAAYQLSKRNVERCAPQDPDCQRYVLAGEQRSRGLEVDINGNVGQRLRLTSALTYQTGAVVIKDLPADSPYSWGAALPPGTVFPGGPRVVANLFAVYTLPGELGLELGGGFNYSSSSELNLPNDGYRLAGERTVNVYGAWKLSSKVRAQLNVNNLFNRLAYSSPGWQGWSWLYFANTPTQATLTLQLKL